MPYKYFILDVHSLANETVGGNFASGADFHVSLNFDEGPYFRFIAYSATVKVYKPRMKYFYVFS
jgi:hypothetical protein